MNYRLLVLTIVIFISTYSLYSSEPLVRFYLNDGSSKQYNLSEIQNFKFINSNLTYIMLIWCRGSNVFGDTRSIDSVFFENNKMKTSFGNHFATDDLNEIDSITFIRNKCQEILIGSQVWTCHNLNVDHYRNGNPIPEVRDSLEWANLSTGAWCYYNNDTALGAIYGKLYNWYAVNDSRGLAPEGWHVPSDSEWTELTIYLGGEFLAGGKLKETGTTYWNSPNTGATNETGFSALPGGGRYGDGAFGNIGYIGDWWSSTEINTSFAWIRYLGCGNDSIYRYGYFKDYGFSVRCIKD